MRTMHLFPFGVAVLIYNLAGSVAAWILEWPPSSGVCQTRNSRT
jgi:hypothetical protein